jgi:hypothetical protein
LPQPAPASLPTRLQFHTPPRYTFRPAIIQLLDIFHRYHEWNDALSCKLHKWIGRINAAIPSTATFEGEITGQERADAREHIRALAQEILFDPIGMVPMRAPVIVDQMLLDQEVGAENVIVDRETWMDYRDVVGALFPARQPPKVPLPHAFAAEIVSWVASLPEDLTKMEESDTAPCQKPGSAIDPTFAMVPPSPQEVVRTKFYKLRTGISNEHVCQLCQQISSMAIAAREECQRLNIVYAELIQTRSLLLKEQLQVENEKMAARLQTISLVHQTRIAELQRTIERLQQEIGNLRQQAIEIQQNQETQQRSLLDLEARMVQQEKQCHDWQKKAQSKNQCSIV